MVLRQVRRDVSVMVKLLCTGDVATKVYNVVVSVWRDPWLYWRGVHHYCHTLQKCQADKADKNRPMRCHLAALTLDDLFCWPFCSRLKRGENTKSSDLWKWGQTGCYVKLWVDGSMCHQTMKACLLIPHARHSTPTCNSDLAITSTTCVVSEHQQLLSEQFIFCKRLNYFYNVIKYFIWKSWIWLK